MRGMAFNPQTQSTIYNLHSPVPPQFCPNPAGFAKRVSWILLYNAPALLLHWECLFYGAVSDSITITITITRDEHEDNGRLKSGTTNEKHEEIAWKM